MWVAMLANPLARLALAGALGLSLGFAGGFLKGHNWANASYWQQQAVAAREAAEKKEQLALADLERARRAEEERSKLESQLETLIHETKASACKLSAGDLQRLRVLAGPAH